MLKSFAQARDFIEIDKKVMADAKRWILRKQTIDGCFPSVGTLHHKAMKVSFIPLYGKPYSHLVVGDISGSLSRVQIPPTTPHRSEKIESLRVVGIETSSIPAIFNNPQRSKTIFKAL